MEGLNVKLVEKYKELKERKAVETQEWHSRQEEEFRKCYQVILEQIQELENENDRFQNEIVKMVDAYAESQNLLLEERRKTKELASEVERCRLLMSKQPLPYSNENGCTEVVPLSSPCNNPQTKDSARRSTRKRKKDLVKGQPDPQNEESIQPTKKRKLDLANDRTQVQDYQSNQSPDQNLQQTVLPDCCRKDPASSGRTGEAGLLKCLYQTLLESLVGIKVSVNTESDLPCLSVSHPSSGYTFSLTWLKRDDGNDGEWYYQVSSLGTLERVAHKWMKEDIVFSLTMCPVFFQRISRVIAGIR